MESVHSQSIRPSFDISPAPTTSQSDPDSPPLSPSQSVFSRLRFGKPLTDPDDGGSLLSECDPASSQDTGYNTELGTHTNLTTQFGTLLETVPKPPADLFTMGQDNDSDNACFPVTMHQEISQGLGQGMSQGLDQGISQGFGQGISQGLGQGITQGFDQGNSQGFGQGISPFNTQGIMHQRQRHPSISRQMSEPILQQHAKLQSSFNSSTSEQNALMQSLPESLLGASIPISISRTSSVAYELSNDHQILNESSPPSVNTTPVIIQPENPKEGALVKQSDAGDDVVVVRRARRALGLDSPMDQGTPSGSSRMLPGGVDWYMQGADTPNRQKITGMARTLQRRQHNVKEMLPSKYCHSFLCSN